jgi:outer membrane protein TolC
MTEREEKAGPSAALGMTMGKCARDGPRPLHTAKTESRQLGRAWPLHWKTGFAPWWEPLSRRPDVAAAERTLAEANAIIGVGYGAFFPTVTLSASGGFESSSFQNWFSWPSRFWSIGPSISQTVFNGGLYRAELHQYTATYNADLTAYRQTALTAFQQVEDYLAAVRIYSQEIQREQEAVKSAEEYLNLEMGRYETGVDPYLYVITAQTTVLSDQETLATLQIEQMVAAVDLIEALGGGWDRSQLPTTSQVSKKPSAGDYKLQH